ncbi:MAG TPA: hypothetical protein VD704_12510 [Gaiellaceae bacterium]|nr:hypothetical protein [Gaiellaceae bacterium]
MKIVLALSLAVAALLAAAAPASAAVVHGDWRLAGYRVKADGTLRGALEAFGQPSRLTRTSDITCSARWSGRGLRIGFYNLGGFNPCSPRRGRFSNAVVTGRQWETNRGLAVGDRARRLHRLYPNARWGAAPGGAGWWLIARSSPVGEGGFYPGLLARMRDGRVAALVVRYPAGGD